MALIILKMDLKTTDFLKHFLFVARGMRLRTHAKLSKVYIVVTPTRGLISFEIVYPSKFL